MTDQIEQKAGDNAIQIGQAHNVTLQYFAEAPVLIANHIRIREFQSPITGQTRDFVGRELIFKALNDLLHDPEFPSGYIVINGEPGIGKTALLGQLVKHSGNTHHFNIASQNIRSHRDFLSNICAQLIARYTLDYAMLPPEAT